MRRISGRNKTGIGRAIKNMAMAGAFLVLIPASSVSVAAPPPTFGAGVSLSDPAHVANLDNALRQNYIAALKMMTEQFVSTMMQQAMAIGAFLDAKHQLETQRLFGQLAAQAHKDYHPDEQMCRIGTNVRSLAMADRRARINAAAFNRIMQDREVMKSPGAGAFGKKSDTETRLQRFKDIYCDPEDENGNMKAMCKRSLGGPDERVNRDVDYTRLIDGSYTLDVDLTDKDVTADEEDVIFLAKNLYAHTLFAPLDEHLLKQGAYANTGPAAQLLQDRRSIYAMRSVAYNSFSSLVGMKAAGDTKVTGFMKKIVEELGVPAADIDTFLGKNPSYFAQMEVLTKMMYQNPAFYTNLYTTPENVKRTGVALQAIGLMQDRDRFEAALRREMLISLIVELKLREIQGAESADIMGSFSEEAIDLYNP